ncbi:mRNA-capping enzyme subunit beta [Actinomortierella ambigua]|uniref:mRNA-capping enzyme subunit beta n=1 Tax=Actinomortierella ambigua TaxID=1343610 RepID=A0A9P6Q070_9FUNG|nr:mRNA-capping enzyme subunit beta [Actinomortierella ambigua]
MSKRPLEDDQHATVAQDQQPLVTESNSKKARTEHEGDDAEKATATTTASLATPGNGQGSSSPAAAVTAGSGSGSGSAPAVGASSNALAHQQQQQQHPSRPMPSTQQQQQVRSARPRGDHAFFGTTVPDDVVRVVSEFLFEHCNKPNVEIEAKLGVLMDNRTGQRISLPVRNEVAIISGQPAWYRFSSDMTLPATQYKHTRETDRFFKDGIQGKVRVTVDQKTGQVVPNGIVKKDRVADLDIYSPRNPFDFRISVNIEAPAQMPTGTPQFERNKDRISYRHNHFKIDLTQVKRMDTQPRPGMYQMQRPMGGAAGGGMNPMDMTHELEIEFVHPEELIREREAWIRSGGQQRERFMDMVGWFVDNIRGLAARGGGAAAAGGGGGGGPGGVGGGSTLAGQMPPQRR